MQSKWIEYKGKKIWCDDYTDFKTDDAGAIAEIEAADGVVCQQPPNSLLVLLDIHNTVASTKLVEVFKQSAVRAKPHVRKTAIVGVSGIRKIFYEAVVRFSGYTNSRLFDDREAALDWLVVDD